MKKILLTFFIMAIVPVWALCPIADGESVCSVQDSSSLPLFMNKNAGTKINSSTKQNKNLGNFNSFGQPQYDKEGIQMKGSLSCQFGNCNTSVNNDFLKNQ